MVVLVQPHSTTLVRFSLKGIDIPLSHSEIEIQAQWVGFKSEVRKKLPSLSGAES